MTGEQPVKIDNGGPAFPIYPRSEGSQTREISGAIGMTLRDYFAFGMMKEYMPKYPRAIAAGMCYEDADAMIQARKATP